MRDMPRELKEVLPKKYHFTNLEKCDESTLHETLGTLINIISNAQKIEHEALIAEQQVFEALYRKGAKEYTNLAIFREDRK
jgi:hypothetical protein